MNSNVQSHRQGLTAAQLELLEKRLRGTTQGRVSSNGINRRHQSAPAPLSFAQQRLWFLDQLEPGTGLYNLSVAFRLSGSLNLEALRRSLDAIIERHEALRTRFTMHEGQPVQIVMTSVPVALKTQKLEPGINGDGEIELQQLLSEESAKPFDLTKDLMLRVLLVQIGPNEHALMLTMHHIASDAWSLGILFNELESLYEGFCRGKTPSLPPLPIQYSDFAVWQRDWLQGDVFERQLAFWKERLARANEMMELPVDLPRPAAQTHRGREQRANLSPVLSEALEHLSQREGCTLFMTLLAAFNAMLFRYTRHTDILVGTPIAGRTRVEMEGLIGFFVNTLVMRTDMSGNPTFRELLQRVRSMTLDAYGHQDLPFEKLVEALRPDRSLNRMPLIQTMFVLQTATPDPLKLPGLTVTPLEFLANTAKFDLTMFVNETERGLQTALEYDTDLFTGPTIRRMLHNFQTLLEGIVADPDRHIAELPLLTESEQHELVTKWNATTTPYPRDKTIHALFEEQVAKRPNAVAVVCGKRELTYAELNARANQVAHRLRKMGVRPDMLVGFCVQRSLDMIVGLVGILKAGGAYVALDPNWPEERLTMLLQDAQASVMVTQKSFRSKFEANRGMRLLCLDSTREQLDRESVENLPNESRAEHLAYVSFTSGSTGRPKGVCIPHHGVVRLVCNTNFITIGPSDVFLQLAPLAFDASTLEIWGPLLNGAKLAVFPPSQVTLSELGDELQRNGVTVLWLTSGLFQQMIEHQIDSLQGVRQLLAGGDVLSVPHVQRALQHLDKCKIINGYGPTENTTFTTCHAIANPCPSDRSIPIGRPIANTSVFIVDEWMQPTPIGVPGELCTGGDGLARGYLNQPELTSEKFITNPFSAEPGARLYKTGDLARYLADGTIEFLGRIDSQVKIRGFRIELAEIETALSQNLSIKECAVIARMDTPGEKRLVAYVVPREGTHPKSNELRDFLLQKLPDYMVPSAFVHMKDLPLNANGKLDRKALPAPGNDRPDLERVFVAPRDYTEKTLAVIWENVLNVRPIGITDKFFELGGHSMLAVRLIAGIEKEFNRKLPLSTIFQSPTVEQLARVLRDGYSAVAGSSIVEIQSKGTKTPLFLVHGVGGGMFWGYNNLARYMGTDQPLYAFKSRGLDGLEEYGRIEEIAAHYVADLLAFQPNGPYYLGGYCFGGDVAFEMARQLHAQGRDIALLVLLNSTPPNSSYTEFSWTPLLALKFALHLGRWALSFTQWPAQQRQEFVAWKLRIWKQRLRTLLHQEKKDDIVVDSLVDLSTTPEHERKLWEAHIHALAEYRPKPYPGRMTLLRTRSHLLFCSFDEAYGWRDYVTGGVTIRILPGSHESLLLEPNVTAVADELRHCLEQARAETVWDKVKK